MYFIPKLLSQRGHMSNFIKNGAVKLTSFTVPLIYCYSLNALLIVFKTCFLSADQSGAIRSFFAPSPVKRCTTTLSGIISTQCLIMFVYSSNESTSTLHFRYSSARSVPFRICNNCSLIPSVFLQTEFCKDRFDFVHFIEQFKHIIA